MRECHLDNSFVSLQCPDLVLGPLHVIFFFLNVNHFSVIPVLQLRAGIEG